MARLGGHLVWGVLLLVLAAGCRTPQPVLKPTQQPEVLTVPPKEARYNNSQYPAQAFRDMDSNHRKSLDAGGSGIMPAGGMGAPGMMPGGGGGFGPNGVNSMR